MQLHLSQLPFGIGYVNPILPINSKHLLFRRSFILLSLFMIAHKLPTLE